MRSKGFTRRYAIKATGAAGMSSVIAPALFWVPAGLAQDATPVINIPASGASLPSDDATLRVLIQGPGPRTPFYEAFFRAYQEAHPNIAIEFEELPEAQIQEVLPLSIRNGEAHDLFTLAGALTPAEAVGAGWIAPLDDVIPDFDAWKAGFPEGVFFEGINQFDGKTYTFPLGSNRRYGTMIFYNQEMIEAAGIDMAAGPLSLDAFRSAAQTLTSQGGGSYFGLALGADPATLEVIVSNFAASSGAGAGTTIGGLFDWSTGDYAFITDEAIAAVELLLGMQADGSILPGAASLTQREAETRVPLGQAAMTLDGPWIIARWIEQNPDFKYGIGSSPTGNPHNFTPLGYAPGGANPHYIYAESELKEVVGDIFSYWGSLEGQTVFQTMVGGALQSILPEAATQANLDEKSSAAVKMFEEQMRLHPDPRARNPAAGEVYLQSQRLQPTFGEVIQGIFSGQLSDPRQAMQDLQDRANAELDRAIAAAQQGGADVSRDDWVFRNWDPAQNYTAEHYEAL